MSTPTAEQLDAALQGFDRLYGLKLEAVSDEEVRASVPVRPELLQPAGLVHGGVYASIAETLASLATALAVIPKGEMAMGLANATSFLRPITEGTIHARATRVHRGSTTWVWDVVCTNDAGKTCAITRMTIAVRPPRAGQELPPRPDAGAAADGRA
jgi:1,4-dihydroxy-2-naphthoyl-CoA hydrolase